MIRIEPSPALGYDYSVTVFLTGGRQPRVYRGMWAAERNAPRPSFSAHDAEVMAANVGADGCLVVRDGSGAIVAGFAPGTWEAVERHLHAESPGEL